MKSFDVWKFLKNHVINFLQAQLVVTIAAIPILVNWGLSISLMTFIGNLLFSPVLTLFLIVSSLVFFTQLLHIPNGYLIALLDWLTSTWANILSVADRRWLIEFSQPPFLVLLAIPIIAVIIMHVLRPKTNGHRIALLSGILGISLITLWLFPHVNQPTPDGQWQTPRGLTITKQADESLDIIDDGFFSSKKSPEKAIEFELKPFLVKQYGHVTINNIVLERPGQRSFTAAQTLCTVFAVKQVTIPFFDKKLSKGAWRSFFNLKRFTQENNIGFKRTGTWVNNPQPPSDDKEFV